VVLLSISCESFHVSMGFDQLCRSNEASNRSPLSSMASYRTNSLNRALAFNHFKVFIFEIFIFHAGP
jgi:hypothetical protein